MILTAESVEIILGEGRVQRGEGDRGHLGAGMKIDDDSTKEERGNVLQVLIVWSML